MTTVDAEDAATLDSRLNAMIERREPGLFEALTDHLGHPDPEIRSTVAFGLGEIVDDRAIDVLIALVDRDDSERVRDEALRALDEFRDSRILDCLVREIDRPKRSRPPRQVVARQLRHYPGVRAEAALTRLLDDEDEFVRSDAAESLTYLRSPGG